MKIERTNKAFQPIELKITIETEEEKEVMLLLFGQSIAVTDRLFGGPSDERWERLQFFMKEIHTSLDVD